MRATARAGDPLEAVREVAESPGLSWAMSRWARVRKDDILATARRRNLAAEAGTIARAMEDNPAFQVKQAAGLKRQVVALMASVILATPERFQRGAKPRRRTG